MPKEIWFSHNQFVPSPWRSCRELSGSPWNYLFLFFHLRVKLTQRSECGHRFAQLPGHFVITTSRGAFVFAEGLLGQSLNEGGHQNLVICCSSGQPNPPHFFLLCLLDSERRYKAYTITWFPQTHRSGPLCQVQWTKRSKGFIFLISSLRILFRILFSVFTPSQ